MRNNSSNGHQNRIPQVFCAIILACTAIGFRTVAWGQQTASVRKAWVDLLAVGFEHNATFFVDGKRVGVNAVTIEIPFGEHELIVQSPGYEPQKSLLVVDETIKRIEIKAGKSVGPRVGETTGETVFLSREKGSLLVTSQPPGLMLVSGDKRTYTTALLEDMPAGTANVVVDGQSVEVEIVGGQQTRLHYDKETRDYRVIYSEATQQMLFERYTHAFMDAVRKMDPSTISSGWSRLKSVGKVEASRNALLKEIFQEFNTHARLAPPMQAIGVLSQLVNEVAGDDTEAKLWCEKLATGLSASIEHNLKGNGWQSAPSWTQALSGLYQNVSDAKVTIAKPMVDAAQHALRSRPPDVRKAIVLWGAAGTLLEGVKSRGFNEVGDDITSALIRKFSDDPSARDAAFEDLEFAMPYLKKIEGPLARTLTAELSKDLEKSDIRWLQRTMKLYRPDAAQWRELGEAIRKCSERLGVSEAERWTDSIKAACPDLAPYTDLAYAYTVLRARGRQAARMVFDTVITRHAGSEAAEIARRENRRIKMLNSLFSSRVVGFIALVIMTGSVVYALRFSPKSAERIVRLKAVACAIKEHAGGFPQKALRYAESVRRNPDSGVMRWGRWCRSQYRAYASMWMVAVQPWRKEPICASKFNAWWAFAGANTFFYFLLLYLLQKNTTFVAGLGTSLIRAFWLLVPGACGVVVLHRVYPRLANKLPMQLVPASSVLLPVFIIPGVQWIFVTAWWAAAGFDFGSAVFAEVTARSKTKLPSLEEAASEITNDGPRGLSANNAGNAADNEDIRIKP